MASNERGRYVIKRISRRNLGTPDEAIGSRAAGIFLNKVRRRPGGSKLLENLSNPTSKRSTRSESGDFGIPDSTYALKRKLAEYPPEVWGWYCDMTSHVLDRGPAERYVRNKRERVIAQRYFHRLGLHGPDLGFVMKHLYDMAIANAQLRRRINRRSV